MCLDDLLASATNHLVEPDELSMPEENWEDPSLGAPLAPTMPYALRHNTPPSTGKIVMR